MMLFVGMSVAFADTPSSDSAGGTDTGTTPATTTTTYDHPLTVTGIAADDTVNFYKVIEWVGEAEGNVGGWNVVSTYDSIKSEIIAAVLGTLDDPKTDADEYVAPTGITSELAGKIADLAADPTVGTVSGTTATLDNPASGMWMALITAADSKTIYNPVFVSADYNKASGKEGTVAMSDTYAGDAVAKKSTVTLTKTAANASDYNVDNAKTTAVGDVVTFTVNTQIPGYGHVYQNPHFDVKDSLTDLELVGGTIAVKAGSTTLTLDTDYTISPESYDKSKTYTVSFTKTYLESLNAATAVTITYNATVTSTAKKAINEESNDVVIEFSHDPTHEDDYDVEKDTTQHYTFTLDAAGAGLGSKLNGKKTSELVKIGLDEKGDPITDTTVYSEITGSESWQGPLQNAEFALYKADQVTLTEGQPTAIKDGETAYKTASTGADGRMTFEGLDAGTYYLQETSAPDGYVTQSAIHTIVIAAETDTVKVTEWWNGSEWVSSKPAGTAKEVTYETEILKSYTVKVDGENTATYTFTNAATANDNEIKWETVEAVEKPFDLPNTKGVELPSTGGMGTTILCVAGSILVLAAGILLVTKRRMNAED